MKLSLCKIVLHAILLLCFNPFTKHEENEAKHDNEDDGHSTEEEGSSRGWGITFSMRT